MRDHVTDIFSPVADLPPRPHRPETGERRLALAIIERAVDDIFEPPTTEYKRRLATEARAWLCDLTRSDPHSVAHCCAVIGWNVTVLARWATAVQPERLCKSGRHVKTAPGECVECARERGRIHVARFRARQRSEIRRAA